MSRISELERELSEIESSLRTLDQQRAAIAQEVKTLLDAHGQVRAELEAAREAEER